MQNFCWLPFLKGCGTGAGLIIAIGAQNAFVLKRGIMRNQVFVTAFFCALADALLISVGVGGFGAFLTSNTILLLIAKWGGAAFLFWYGFRAFRSVFKKNALTQKDAKGPERPSLQETLVTLFVLTFFNPHVYVDAVVLLGSIGAQHEDFERPFFAFGAILASFVWFFSVCYGARLLSPLFENPKAWKVLDFIIGCIMWGIGLTLLLPDSCFC